MTNKWTLSKAFGRQNPSISTIWRLTGIAKTSLLKSTWIETAIGTRLSCLGKEIAARLQTATSYAQHDYDPCITSYAKNRLKEQLKTGIVEEVPAGDLTNKAASQSYYFPHLAVVRAERETTKVRVVYDGSAKASKEEKSLNDCLQTGPNYLPQVFDMLANFRKNIVGLTADIEKAFLTVGIQDDKRDFLQFLWLTTQAKRTRRLFISNLRDSYLVYAPREYSWTNNLTSPRTVQTKRPRNGLALRIIILRWWPVNVGVQRRKGPRDLSKQRSWWRGAGLISESGRPIREDYKEKSRNPKAWRNQWAHKM